MELTDAGIVYRIPNRANDISSVGCQCAIDCFWIFIGNAVKHPPHVLCSATSSSIMSASIKQRTKSSICHVSLYN